MRLNSEVQERWVEELIEMCNEPAQVVSDGRILPILDAAEDLNGWLNDPRQYNGQHKPGWESSKDDFKASYDALGPNVKNLLRTEVTALMIPLGHLPDPGLRTGDPGGHRADAKAKYTPLATHFKTNACVIAAWRDLVDGCKDETLEVNGLKLRRDNLWRIAHRLGINVSSLGIGFQLRDVLADNEFDIANALADLGDRDYPNPGEFDLRKSAGLDIKDRLDICERLLQVTPPTANTIVWLCIMNASMPRVMLDCENGVVFYDREWIKGNLLDGGTNKDQLPAELLGSEERPGADQYDFPDAKGKRFIWVRIDLGMGIVSSAPTRAKAIVTAMIVAAGTTDTDSWKLLDGYILFRDGQAYGRSMFIPPVEFPPSPPALDYTANMLEDLKAELSSVASLTTVPMVTNVLNTRRWLSEVSEGESVAKLVLSVRVLELIASWVTDGAKTWQDFCKDYLKDVWCQQFLSTQLFGACRQTLYGGSEFLSKEGQEKQAEMAREIMEPGRALNIHFHPDKAIPKLPDLITMFKDTTKTRELQEVSDIFSSGVKVANKLDDLAKDFDRVLARLIRYRNAAQHGGPVVDELVESVDNFAHLLASISTRNTLRALLDSKDPETTQADIQSSAQQGHTDLQNGAPSERLFTSGI